MIIRSGFNVYPAEIEAVLNSHACLRWFNALSLDVAVEGNEEVVAFRAVAGGLRRPNTEDLMAHVAPQLTSYKRPSEIIVLQALPATSTGKILKHKLAESLPTSLSPQASPSIR